MLTEVPCSLIFKNVFIFFLHEKSDPSERLNSLSTLTLIIHDFLDFSHSNLKEFFLWVYQSKCEILFENNILSKDRDCPYYELFVFK